MKKVVFLTGLVLAAVAVVFAQRHAFAGRSTDVVVDTNELGPINLNEKVDAKERVIFYEEGNTAVSINEDGDPNVGMRF